MKKLTLFLSAMLLACATSLWAETVTYQHVFNAKPNIGNDIELSGVKWNIEATALNNYNSANYAGVQFGSKSSNGSITLTSSSDWNYNGNTKITEVRLWLNLGGTSVTPSVTIGGKPATSDGTVVTKNGTAKTDWKQTTKVTFTPAADGNTGVVVINVTSVKAGYICAMEIDCEAESSSTATLTALTISGTPNKTNYEEGEAFDPTGLVVTGTYDDGKTKTITEGITWTINPDVLTAGTTFVSVEATLNGVTSDPFKVENIVVTDAPQPGDEVTVTFEAGVDKASSENNTTITKNGITLTATTFDNTNYYQTFKNNTFKATSTQGKIKSIVFTCTVNGIEKYGPGNYTIPEGGIGTYNYEEEGPTGTWSGSAAEVVLLAETNQVRMTKVVITYVVADPNAPDAPVISGETIFNGTTDVSITAGENLKIYYTTNGDEPTTASTLYTAPFAITATTTVKAIAVNETTSSISDVAEKTFTHKDAVTLAAIDYTTNGTKVFLQSVTVVYANGAYTYLKDETGVGLLYGSNFNFTAGDLVTGIAATTKVYSNLPELLPTVTLEDLTVTSGVAPSPAEAKAVPTAEEVNTYLLLKGVTLAEDAATVNNSKLQNVKVTFKDGTVDLRDQFGVVSDGTIKAGSYDVEGFVSVYNTTVQFYITKISSTPSAITNTTLNTQAFKTIENGQLIIIRDGKKYNATGIQL